MKLDKSFLNGMPIFYFRKTYPVQTSFQVLRKEEMTKKSRKAYNLLRQAKIKCYWLYSDDKKAPYIEYGSQEYRGVRGIKRFVRLWKKMRKLLEKHLERSNSSIPAN